MTVILKPRPKVDSEHTLQDTIAKDNTAERTKETVLIVQQEVKEQVAILKSKAPKLANALGGTYEERMKTERSIHLIMKLDARPEVVFSGFWDGRLIQSAMNAIARQYRQRRIVVSKM